MSIYKVFFTPPGTVPASNSLNKVILVVDFFRTIDNVFDSGYD